MRSTRLLLSGAVDVLMECRSPQHSPTGPDGRRDERPERAAGELARVHRSDWVIVIKYLRFFISIKTIESLQYLVLVYFILKHFHVNAPLSCLMAVQHQCPSSVVHQHHLSNLLFVALALQPSSRASQPNNASVTMANHCLAVLILLATVCFGFNSQRQPLQRCRVQPRRPTMSRLSEGSSDELGSPRVEEATPAATKLDPLIASLTRIDESAAGNVPMSTVPIFGDVPADGNMALLIPAAGIAVLGFIFSIVVAFNARDEIVADLSKVEIPKMEYVPTKVVEGQCRGLCSNQEEDLDGLRNFMGSFAKNKE